MMTRLSAFASLAVLVLVAAGCSEAAPDQVTPTTLAVVEVPTTLQESEPVLVAPSPPSLTESALVGIRQRGELRVGILYNYPPFGTLVLDGSVGGFEVDLAREIANRWGVSVSFVQVTRQTRLPLLETGAIDIIGAAMPHRRELESLVDFSETTFRSGTYLLVSGASGIQSADQIGAGPIGVLGHDEESVTSDYFAARGMKPTTQMYTTIDEATRALGDDVIKAISGRREQLILASSVVPDTQILEEPLLEEPYAFAVRRGDAPLRDLLNLTLQAIIAENAIGEIFTSNFYGYAADAYAILPGDSPVDMATFPSDLPTHESALARFRRGEPLRVAGLDLTAQPQPFDSLQIVDGFNRAVINEMARRWRVAVVETPQSAGDAGLGLLRDGQTDIVVGLRADRSQMAAVSFSEPYYARALRLIHLTDVTVYGIGDLEFKPSMVTDPVDVSRDLVEDNNGNPDIQQASSYEEGFDSLTNRIVNAVIGDEFALVLMSRADDRIVFDERRYRPVDYAMAVSPYDSDLLSLINFTLQDMYKDGILNTLQQQYLAPYLPVGEDLDPFDVELWPGDGSFLGFPTEDR